jgi:hypothetical protein
MQVYPGGEWRMKRLKYNFIKLEMSDYYEDLPDQWNENVEITIELIDELFNKISMLEQEVKRLKEAREWP